MNKKYHELVNKYCDLLEQGKHKEAQAVHKELNDMCVDIKVRKIKGVTI
jgi:hypothetical protein